ncbi:MerR family DNA-binding protein [Duganella sp. FT80W]|uniref:MerR family DNA-binding protein n=1 Tax=Duganella guangzhouensis TaxID=2666084 RepID=A0A6I2L0Y0_9BURK|nr:helix-turn-helix domain-containing protein [Duganella guangzhouensis]MRW91838.1 MerR family DNA-binding protein [Duganella guangzhouensis]
MTTSFSIGQLASAAQTPAATIRYYEKIGLLSKPSRTDSNYRLYDTEDLNRLAFVRRAREIGFTIDQVRSLLAFSDQRDADCCTVTAMTSEHLRAVEQKIADLLALKDQLTGLLASCQGGPVANCRIIDALQPRA